MEFAAIGEAVMATPVRDKLTSGIYHALGSVWNIEGNR